jgi:hypothetical protein
VTTTPAETTHGLTAVAGIQLSAFKIKVAPEFRYNRWNRHFWEKGPPQGFFTGSSLNQFEILVGISR